MMTFWTIWKFPLRIIYLIFFCNSLIYLNAHSNESISNNQWNFGDNPPSLRRHYETIFNLLKKSVSGETLIKLENKKLPIQVLGCVPGDQMIIATFPVHKQSEKSETHRVCSDEINAAAIIDFKNALTRLSHLNEALKHMIESHKALNKTVISNFTNSPDDHIEIGMYLIDDCNNENLSRDLIESVSKWSTDDVDMQHLNPCFRSPGKGHLVGTFSSFPIRNFNSTYYDTETGFENTIGSTIITKDEVQNFSFETFRDSYITCSILRHFGWTRVGLIYDHNFDREYDQFLKIAGFFNICVNNKQELKNVRNNATNNVDKCGDFSVRNDEVYIDAYVIFSNRPCVFRDMIPTIKQFRLTKSVFIIREDLLPQDRKLIQTSTFLVFRKEVKQVHFIDDETLKFTPEYRMTNEIFNLECNFPENEFSFVQRIISNDAGNTSKSEFPDLHVSSDVKCKRTFLSKLDEIFYRLVYTLCFHSKYNDVCLNILEKLLMQFSSDSSWLQLLHTMNLSIEPENISIGNGTWDASRKRIIFQTLPNATEYLSVNFECRATSVCKLGQREKIINKIFCCLACEDCEPNQISIWNECQNCRAEEWPNKDRTECEPKKKRPLQWDDLEIVICVTYSTIIVMMVVTTLWIFIKKRNTPVVKSSTRELSFMMFVSMIAVESTIFIFMSSRENPLCSLIQVVSVLSFCTLYTGLLVKTVRIARLLALSRNEFPQLSMKCMSTKSQVIIMIHFIVVELVISLLMLYLTTPLLSKNRDYEDPQGRVTPMLTPICRYNLNTFTSNFSFIFGLVAVCTGCAVWVRKVPDNFNEAKYIGFCMYATCLTWTAFGFTLLTEHGYEILALCVCFSTNNFLALMFLFFPKLYIIIFKPEKNDRKYFKTSSESMRVHKRKSRKENVLLKNLDEKKN